MPIHFKDLDVVSEAAGLSSALIVPCIMCPGATVAMREKKPFMKFFSSLLKSAPLEQYIKDLQSRLREKGVNTKVFKSNIAGSGSKFGLLSKTLGFNNLQPSNFKSNSSKIVQRTSAMYFILDLRF